MKEQPAGGRLHQRRNAGRQAQAVQAIAAPARSSAAGAPRGRAAAGRRSPVMRRHPERLAVEPAHVERASLQREHLPVEPELVHGGDHLLALLVAQLDLAGWGLQVAVEAQRRVFGCLQVDQPLEPLAGPPFAGACGGQIAGLVQMAQDGFQVGGR